MLVAMKSEKQPLPRPRKPNAKRKAIKPDSPVVPKPGTNGTDPGSKSTAPPTTPAWTPATSDSDPIYFSRPNQANGTSANTIDW